MRTQLKDRLDRFNVKNLLADFWESKSNTARLLELAAFAFLLPVLGLIFFDNDPYGIKTGFPWITTAAVLFAARYGSAWGFTCALGSALFVLFFNQAYEGYGYALVALAIGTVVVSIIVGDASSAWRRRSNQAEAENQYLRHRLKEFSNDYHVLKVSHGQLEEFMAGQRLSLRQALQQLKPVLSANPDGLLAGSELMAIFAQFCSVQVAGLYAMSNDSSVDKKAVALHGNMGKLPTFDPLLKMAIKTHQLVSVKLQSQESDVHHSGLLAVVPIVDSQDHLHGVLAVKDMHFMAFQQENLNILALLGGYVGDMLSRSRGVGLSQTGWFLAELNTALRFAKTHGVQSALLCMQFEQTEYMDEVAQMVSTNIRSLDSSWIPQTKNGFCTVVILLPLISQSHCNAYLRRIGQSVRKDFQLELQDLLRDVQTMQISKKDTRESCLDFINQSTGFIENDEEAATVSKIRRRRVA